MTAVDRDEGQEKKINCSFDQATWAFFRPFKLPSMLQGNFEYHQYKKSNKFFSTKNKWYVRPSTNMIVQRLFFKETLWVWNMRLRIWIVFISKYIKIKFILSLKNKEREKTRFWRIKLSNIEHCKGKKPSGSVQNQQKFLPESFDRTSKEYHILFLVLHSVNFHYGTCKVVFLLFDGNPDKWSKLVKKKNIG